MTEKQAAKILEDHNIWRRGADTKPTDPRALGKAIEVAVKALRRGKAKVVAANQARKK